MSEKKVIIILLSTYNGRKYIKDQIESIIRQDINKDGRYKIKILARDDGSKDDTVSILNEFSSQINIDIICGQNIGPAKSFWELLNKAPSADYYSFCDQDDVWFNDKLSRAISVLEKCDKDVPQLYCSTVRWVDKNLEPINVKNTEKKYTDFPHSLLFSLSQGCTFVFNQSAQEVAKRYDFSTNNVEMHDWIMHKVVALFGKVYFDKIPSLSYRQHGDNVIGNKDQSFFGIINRIKNTLMSNRCDRSKTAKSLLNTYHFDINNCHDLYTLDLVANYKTSFKKRLLFIFEKSFKSSFFCDLKLFFLILLGKV